MKIEKTTKYTVELSYKELLTMHNVLGHLTDSDWDNSCKQGEGDYATVHSIYHTMNDMLD